MHDVRPFAHNNVLPLIMTTEDETQPSCVLLDIERNLFLLTNSERGACNLYRAEQRGTR
jgi:hypothetical protein